MHYIKDIFEKKETQHAHNKFIRYSKGNFVGPLMKIKFSKQEVKIGASYHFNDELLKIVANYLGDKIVHIKGLLIWNLDLSVGLERLGIKYSKVSKSRGIFKYTLDNEVCLKKFVDEMGNYNLLITIKTENAPITTKSALPKPNKEFGADFCKVKLPGEFKDEILKEFVFDLKTKEKIKSIEIKHKIEINDIRLPKIEDFEKARRLAKRIGIIKRFVSVNGSEFKESSIEYEI